VKLSHRLKTRELSYLHQDLAKSILRIQNTYSLEYYDQSLLAQIQEKVSLLAPIHIGAAGVLDSIQYLLGEMQTGLWEEEPLWVELEKLLYLIQDYLDWVSK
jgi:hypothetical protein